jgi:two-component system response regulator DegU
MSTITLSIADDHRLFRMGFVSMLSGVKDFHFLFEAGNGQELIDQLENQLCDIVLLDVNMPVMDGIKATGIIRERFPSVKIIVISMYDEDRFVTHMLELGVNGYLLKDSSPEEVEKAIRQVHTEGAYYSDFVGKALHRKLLAKKQPDKAPVPSHTALATDLSVREKDVLRLLCDGLSTAEIGDRLCLSARTVEGYRQRIIEKTGARNIAQAIAFAYKRHLI